MNRTHNGGFIPFELSGSGTGAVGVELILKAIAGRPAAQDNGKIGKLRYLMLRQETGGGATECVVYLVHRKYDWDTISDTPREYIVAKTDTITDMTPSDTEAFLDTGFDHEPLFLQNLEVVIDVTAGAGDWTIQGFVLVEI